MSEWAHEELGGAQLGDRRRVARLVRVTELLSEHPGESVPDACGSWADTEGAYRLWSNGKVKPEAIYEAHFRCTATRAAHEELVLVVQDGSALDFTPHWNDKAVKEMGYLEGEFRRGILIHPTLALTASGVPIGLADMQTWSRPVEEFGKRDQRHKRPIDEKESYVWLLAWDNAQKRLPKEVPLLGIADQEADIFDLFAAHRRPNAHLLIRATGDRRVGNPARLLSKAIRQMPPAGTFEFEVPRRPGLSSRTAVLTLRFAPEIMLRSKYSGAAAPNVPVWCVVAEEENPPKGVKPLQWLLLTTMEVASFQEALRAVGYYKQRWMVEQYFYVLKQGSLVEDLHLETVDRIERALACYAVVAWRLLFLTIGARLDPHGPATTFLADHEWKALLAYHYPRRVPKIPPTKREAIRLIARLGGFLARRGDGDPGVKTVWRGLDYLQGLAVGYRLASEMRSGESP